jgi:hypothetical protein
MPAARCLIDLRPAFAFDVGEPRPFVHGADVAIEVPALVD